MTAGKRTKIQTQVMQPTVYLDCNATTPTHPEALQAAREAMDLCFGNPSSTHMSGLHAKSFLESARDAAAAAIGAEHCDEIIFNSGATEGIQSCVFSVLIELLKEFRMTGRITRSRILYGATEHKAVPSALHHWTDVLQIPVKIEAIPVDSNGILELNFIKAKLNETALLCTMAVNNETGVIQPLETISKLLLSPEGKECLWFVDGVQALGKIKLNVSTLGAHYCCFSGHKLNAPKGIGFLWVKHNTPYTPLIVGGGQERGKRSGTENLPGAAAFGRILHELNNPTSSMFLTHGDLHECRQKLISTLTQCFPTLTWNVDVSLCVPTTLNFSVEGISGREIMNAFDAAGIRVSGGSACSSGQNAGSHVLVAMNLPAWRTQNAIRLSFSPANTLDDIELACRAIQTAGEALRASCMVPHRPALANQWLQFSQLSKTGISELRSSNGTRAWLINCEKSNSFLVADCDATLTELQEKLECRGLSNTQILRLNSTSPDVRVPDDWSIFKSASGVSFGYEMSLPGILPSQDSHQLKTVVLFMPNRLCLTEFLESEFSKRYSKNPLLACFASEPTALTSYEFRLHCGSFANGFSSSETEQAGLQTMLPRESQPPVECNKSELRRLLAERDFIVLDVREPFECATSHVDEILKQNFKIPKATNKKSNAHSPEFMICPLSQMPQFILERLMQPQHEQWILCVCRSGQRSLQAAELLRRLPGCSAFSLKGGLADLLAPQNSLPPQPTKLV